MRPRVQTPLAAPNLKFYGALDKRLKSLPSQGRDHRFKSDMRYHLVKVRRSSPEWTPACHAGDHEFKSRTHRQFDNLLPWLNWLQHLTLNQGILGSSPSGGTSLGSWLQLAQHLACTQVSESSSLSDSTKLTRRSSAG